LNGMKQTVHDIGQNIVAPCVDALFPPRCAGCGRRGHWVCRYCAEELEQIIPPFCQRCGEPWGRACRCAHLAPSLDRVRSAAWYDGWLRTAIQHFKYEGEFARTEHLAELLQPLVSEFGQRVQLVPVPLHPSRRRQRGYNQAERVAKALARSSGCDVADVLERSRATIQQVGLPATERYLNVRDAFAVSGSASISGGRFVLIDDVMTTGATLGACASALHGAGASWVGALTVARER
jgi:ComF family protein